jgi:uroporphyrinogen III methyltransferase/synthase
MTQPPSKRGLGVLVGAGPGDPGLITVAGAKWLSVAEVVLYDRLAAPSLLDLCPAAAERIYVGKGPDAHAMTQEQINALLVAKCAQGKLVVRLKGGDPLIFGRGGEEADALLEAGLPYRIVPGVTAAIAAGALAGIPLTDRRFASCVAFITGHEDPGKDESSLNFQALAGMDTLVFYMGVGNLSGIAERLIAAGRDGSTPVAIVANATRPNQRTLVATLATAADAAERAGLKPPAVLIVGQVVQLRERLAWVERLPLFGQTVLVTRTRQQASQLADRLAQLGADVIECPTIDIAPPTDPGPMDAALARLGDFDWLVLTSPNGAAAVIERLAATGRDGRAMAGLRIAAVGPGTAEVLRANFLTADLMPAKFTTEALADHLTAGPQPVARPGVRFLLARADIATDTLPAALKAAGASVEELVVYRTIRPAALPAAAVEALRTGRADWITFTSSSTVENFLALAQAAGVEPGRAKLASIGPVTTEALTAHALTPTVAADPHTIDGLVAAMEEYGRAGRARD